MLLRPVNLVADTDSTVIDDTTLGQALTDLSFKGWDQMKAA